MEQQKTYDVLVVGAGPGGYVAAIRASQLGLKAAVIEKDKTGGVCLNIGCIPSKSLIHQASLFQSIQGLEAMGLKVDKTGFDYRKVQEKSRQAADRLSKGVQFLLKKNEVDLVTGEAVRIKPGSVTLKDGQVLAGKNILIATGSRPRELPGFEFDEERILSSTGALMQQSLPKSLLILGAGAIGVEFAHIMNAFGVEVHLVEMMDRILPLEDEEVVDVLRRSFKKRGITMDVSTKAVSQSVVNGHLSVELEDAAGVRRTIEVDQMLVSAGRVPNTAGLGLEETGVRLDKGGFIEVGDYYETAVPGIYAVGDVIRSPLLAHVASKEGEIVVERIAGRKVAPKIDPSDIPGAVYCEPQIASFGLTERDAKDKGIAFQKSTFPYRGAGKAVAIEQLEGLVKVLTDSVTGEILGAHIAGADATELIHELLLARHAELLAEDIAGMIHAHPTLSEAVMESMRQAGDGAIHV